MKKLELGKVQMKVMRVLWDKGRITAQEITNEINKTEPMKHSTVQTFLRSMVKKGAVKYDVEDRTFIYYPIVKEDQVRKYAVESLIEHAFQGSLEGFASYIVNNKYLTDDELEKIQKKLNNKKR